MGNELRRDFLCDPGNFGDSSAADRGLGEANSQVPCSMQNMSSCWGASSAFLVLSPVVKEEQCSLLWQKAVGMGDLA